MSKHAKPVHALDLHALCSDVVSEIYKAADGPTTWVLQFVCKAYRQRYDCQTRRESTASFSREAFRDGDLVRVQWAHRHGMSRNRLDYYTSPAASNPWRDFTNPSAYFAGDAIFPDERADHVVHWYLQTIFFPSVRYCLVQDDLVYADYVSRAGRHLLAQASRAGRLDYIHQIVDAGFTITDTARCDCCLFAAMNDRVAVVEYFLTSAAAGEYGPLAYNAASHGNLDTLALLLRYASTTVEASAPVPGLQSAYSGAAYGGHVDVLDWLVGSRYGAVQHVAPLVWHAVEGFRRATTDQSAQQHFASVVWVATRIDPSAIDTSDVIDAVWPRWPQSSYDQSSAAVLEWFLEHYPPTSAFSRESLQSKVAQFAASTGDMPLLAVLLRRGYTVDFDIVWTALNWNGNCRPLVAACVIWLVRHGAPLSSMLYKNAMRRYDVRFVHWLRDVAKCPGYDTVADQVDRLLSVPERMDAEYLRAVDETLAGFPHVL